MHPVSSIKTQDAGSWPLWLLFPSLITITGKSKSSHSERISELVRVHRWLSHFALCSYGDITVVIAERWPWGDGSMEMCVSVCTRDICLCVRVGLRVFKDDVWVKRLVSSWSWGLWFPSRGTCGPTCGFFSGWVKIWLLHRKTHKLVQNLTDTQSYCISNVFPLTSSSAVLSSIVCSRGKPHSPRLTWSVAFLGSASRSCVAAVMQWERNVKLQSITRAETKDVSVRVGGCEYVI